ncbi:MAG: asparagine synthase C-terminal domain-containing protein [Zoogloea sp.]|uniref:asparagine synthetase B family protein n=1 Tax=Zoogloea sp. TaxID=49181 RepID=UPI0026257392|nr:asparagine synthase C-terminal domain-containing protein [Zoogloea sp.]MDD2989327.1 asparagine synthase C-terminal domain-containing protein [Zoogloea sp.]
MESKTLIHARLTAPRSGIAPDLAIQPSPEGWSCSWAGGRMNVSKPATLAERNGILCVSRGAPRFAEAGNNAAELWLTRFEQRGAKAVDGVKGRYAVAFIDTRSNTVTLFNDKFDTEPWCYGVENGELGLADRADGVPLEKRTISAQTIFDYLYFHVIPSPLTIFNEVHRLPPASQLQWSGGKAKISKHWLPEFGETPGISLAEAKGRFLDIVRESVRNEYAGPDTGSFLSGGTDSSTVSGMLCQVGGAPARTYSMGFNATGYDEMEYARIAAKHFKTDHHEYYVTPEDLLEGIPLVARSYDQPFGNSSAVPAWICASRARADGITKLLAGDGGDELFGGNSRYAKQKVFGWYDTIPSLLRSTLVEPLSGLPGLGSIPLVKKGVSYVEQARVPMPDRMEMYNLLHRLGIDTVFEPGFCRRVDLDSPGKLQRATWGEVKNASLVNRMLAFDWKYTLADNDLPKVIGTTRLAGVDVGFPFLSDELLDFSLTLPTEWKLKGLKLRWLFKEALRGFLPDEIITKKKHGFGLPFGIWAVKHPGLSKLATENLEAFAARGVIRPGFIRELHEKWLPESPGYYGEMVWIIMMLEQWLQAYAPDWKMDK